MSGHQTFDKLCIPIDADPRRRARVARFRRAMRDVLALAKLREARGATQVEVGEALGMSQVNVSRIEHEDDVYLSTLSNYVEALGGRLELTAVFPDQTIRLTAAEASSQGVELDHQHADVSARHGGTK